MPATFECASTVAAPGRHWPDRQRARTTNAKFGRPLSFSRRTRTEASRPVRTGAAGCSRTIPMAP